MRALIVGLILCATSPAFAADNQTVVRQVTVNGTADRKVVPDQAHVMVNVNGLDNKLEAAKAQHDKKLKEVIAIAKANGIDEKQIKTQHSSIQPQYTYENNKRVFKGYQVETSINLTVKNTAKLGDLIEKLSAAKLETGNANEWQGLLSVNYTLSNADQVRDEVLADAIKNARVKAERMAAAAGAQVGKVLVINEAGTSGLLPLPVLPVMAPRMAMMAKGGAEMAADAAMAPPPGEQEVNANVTVSFELN